MTDLAVVGAGTMGAGIAESAVLAGLRTVVMDSDGEALSRSSAIIENNLERRVRKGTLSADQRTEALALLQTTTSIEDLTSATFVVEAVFEDLSVKKEVFSALADVVPEEAVLATNTSSLSVAQIASTTSCPGRIVGMHFFNPVPALRLVEIVAGPHTNDPVIERCLRMAKRLGKIPIRASDTPGFVVNRVARPFYLEALRLVEVGAEPKQIDAAARGAGFRMGPLELIDLVGLDVNLAVSESLYERHYGLPRFRPSPLQREMVEAGLLGRKSGRGFYRHDGRSSTEDCANEAEPGGFSIVGSRALARVLGVETGSNGVPVIALRDEETLASAAGLGPMRPSCVLGARAPLPGCLTVEFVGDVRTETRKRLDAAARAAGLTPAWTPDLPGGVALRLISCLVNEAAYALAEGVADAADIDRAMRLGTNYPRGPLAWADEIGLERILRLLDALRSTHGDAYAASPLLRQRAAVGLAMAR